MGKAHKGKTVVVPKVVFNHIRIECGKVSRRFHLNEDNSEELCSHIQAQVLFAIGNRYNPVKGTVYTFAQRVVHNQLCKWMARAVREREALREHTIAKANACARQRASQLVDRNDSVDDTSYLSEDRWDWGEIVPEAHFGETEVANFEGLMRLKVVAEVRQVILQLRGPSKRLCQWHLKTGSLRRTAQKMRLDSKRFFSFVWPRCRTEFKTLWERVEESTWVVNGK